MNSLSYKYAAIIFLILIVLIGAGFFLLRHLQNNSEESAVSKKAGVEAENIGEIPCPLDIDQCAMSEIVTKKNGKDTLSELSFHNIATDSAIHAIFSGRAELKKQPTEGVYSISLANGNLRADYYYHGIPIFQTDSVEVQKGQTIAMLTEQYMVFDKKYTFLFTLHDIAKEDGLMLEKTSVNKLKVKY